MRDSYQKSMSGVIDISELHLSTFWYYKI